MTFSSQKTIHSTFSLYFSFVLMDIFHIILRKQRKMEKSCYGCSLPSLTLSPATVKLFCNCPKDAWRTDNWILMASSFFVATSSFFFTSSFLSILFLTSKLAIYHFFESFKPSNRDVVMGMSSIKERYKIA